MKKQKMFVVVTALAALLSACGGGSNSGGNTGASISDSSSSVAAQLVNADASLPEYTLNATELANDKTRALAAMADIQGTYSTTSYNGDMAFLYIHDWGIGKTGDNRFEIAAVTRVKTPDAYAVDAEEYYWATLPCYREATGTDTNAHVNGRDGFAGYTEELRWGYDSTYKSMKTKFLTYVPAKTNKEAPKFRLAFAAKAGSIEALNVDWVLSRGASPTSPLSLTAMSDGKATGQAVSGQFNGVNYAYTLTKDTVRTFDKIFRNGVFDDRNNWLQATCKKRNLRDITLPMPDMPQTAGYLDVLLDVSYKTNNDGKPTSDGNMLNGYLKINQDGSVEKYVYQAGEYNIAAGRNAKCYTSVHIGGMFDFKLAYSKELNLLSYDWVFNPKSTKFGGTNTTPFWVLDEQLNVVSIGRKDTKDSPMMLVDYFYNSPYGNVNSDPSLYVNAKKSTTVTYEMIKGNICDITLFSYYNASAYYARSPIAPESI